MPNLSIAVLGTGRMGQEILHALARADDLQLVGVWARPGSELYGQDMSAFAGPTATGVVANDDLAAIVSAADVAIDFTLPDASQAVLDAVQQSGTPLVCGVSGLAAAALDRMQALSADVAILYDRNMSFGIALLDALVQQAGAALGLGFAAEVHETHHVHKMDAPSGTALKLGETLAAGRGQDFAAVRHYDPDGTEAQVPPEAIRFIVSRQGDVPGDHTVVLSSAAERLELTHRVSDRRVYADGALQAAVWLLRQGPGRYCMKDVLRN